MHTKPMSESQGTFDAEWRKATGYHEECQRCHDKNVWWRSWESSCGGYEDHQYKCRHCGHTYWVEGPDA